MDWGKGQKVRLLAFQSKIHPETPANIIVDPTFDFETEHECGFFSEAFPDVQVCFPSLKALIRMKSRDGRLKDRDDVQHLNWILEERQREDPIDPWEAATWEGVRKAQLRSSLKLSIAERLAAVEDFQETSDAVRHAI